MNHQLYYLKILRFGQTLFMCFVCVTTKTGYFPAQQLLAGLLTETNLFSLRKELNLYT
jgi:hypothetical protein